MKVRFTDAMMATLTKQARGFRGAAEYLRAMNADGMTVQRELAGGKKLNVTFTDVSGSPIYRTVRLRDVVEVAA